MRPPIVSPRSAPCSRARAAAQGDDSVHPHLTRPVRGGEPFGGWHVRGDHHAAGARPDPLQHRLPLSRRLAERPQPVHAHARARAAGELQPQPERHAGAAEGLFQLQRRRAHLVRDAQHQRIHRLWHALGSAATADAARQHARERQRRLRPHSQSDAALRLFSATGTPRTTSASASTTSRSAPTRPRIRITTSACSTWGLWAAACSRVRGCR